MLKAKAGIFAETIKKTLRRGIACTQKRRSDGPGFLRGHRGSRFLMTEKTNKTTLPKFDSGFYAKKNGPLGDADEGSGKSRDHSKTMTRAPSGLNKRGGGVVDC